MGGYGGFSGSGMNGGSLSPGEVGGYRAATPNKKYVLAGGVVCEPLVAYCFSS